MVFETCQELITGNFEGGFSEFVSQCGFGGSVAGGFLGGLIAIGILVGLLIFVALYIYNAMAWMAIARKLKYKHVWMVWVPIINLVPVLQLGGFGWGWIFLLLIPVLGWLALFIMFIIALWRIFKKRNHPGWFSLGIIIPKIGGILYLIAIGIVAWSDKPKRKRKR